MHRKIVTALKFYFVAPVVLVSVVLSLKISIDAAYENHRVALARTQIVELVMLARRMRIPEQTPLPKAYKDFLTRVDQEGIAPLYPVPKPNEPVISMSDRWIGTPWGERVSVGIDPSLRLIRFEIPLSSNACRRILLAYTKEAGTMRFNSIDIKPRDSATFWTKLYPLSPQAATAPLAEEVVYRGCRSLDDVRLSLTFHL